MTKRNTKRVDIKALFRWKRELPIIDESGEEVTSVWQRIVNDKQQEEARLSALRASRAMRLALRDETTPEFAALAENLETAEKEQLINVVITNEFGKMYETAGREVTLQMPKHPGPDASLEQLEEYEHAVDEYNDKRSDEVLKVVDRLIKTRKEKLEALSEKDFLEITRRSFENQICNNVINEHLLHYLTFLGTYVDENCTARYFTSFSDFEELARQIKEQLVRGYNTIRIGQEELKN